MGEFETLKQQFPRVRRGVPLKKHTTFRIGGAAKYFFAARTSDELESAVRTAKELELPFFLLSGGSNVLVSDNGFPGLVIQIKNSKFKIENSAVRAEAGVQMATLVKETGKRGLQGLEWAGGLPGTLGGAVRGNAGAFGGEIKDSVLRGEAIDQKGKRRMFSKKQCKFSYRSSIFKERGYIVLSATLQLKKGDKKNIQTIAKKHIQYRKEKHPLEYPSAGSIFKNCDLAKTPKKMQEHFKDVIKMDPFPVIPTAVIIARANLPGLRCGGAQVSEKHPNYIVNRGDARAKDVLELIAKVKREIKNKFGVDLEEEITIL